MCLCYFSDIIFTFSRVPSSEVDVPETFPSFSNCSEYVRVCLVQGPTHFPMYLSILKDRDLLGMISFLFTWYIAASISQLLKITANTNRPNCIWSEFRTSPEGEWNSLSLVKKGEIRMVLRMSQDGPRMDIAQHPSSPEDGFKDGNCTPKGCLRIIQDFILDAMCIPSRMLQDGSRMAKDGPKDHPRFYPRCGEYF